MKVRWGNILFALGALALVAWSVSHWDQIDRLVSDLWWRLRWDEPLRRMLGLTAAGVVLAVLIRALRGGRT